MTKHQGGWELDESKKEAALRETIEEAGVRGIVGVRHLLKILGLKKIKHKHLLLVPSQNLQAKVLPFFF